MVQTEGRSALACHCGTVTACPAHQASTASMTCCHQSFTIYSLVTRNFEKCTHALQSSVCAVPRQIGSAGAEEHTEFRFLYLARLLDILPIGHPYMLDSTVLQPQVVNDFSSGASHLRWQSAASSSRFFVAQAYTIRFDIKSLELALLCSPGEQ